MQKIRIILVLITIGCIVGPIGTVAFMYRNNLGQMVIPSNLQQLFPNNDNSNNNGNNNNNGNSNSNDNGNNNNSNNINSNDNTNNGGIPDNSGNVNNNNPSITNPTSSFGGSSEFDVSPPNSQSSSQMVANVNCLVYQNGNSIQLGLDLTPTDVPNDLQSIFNSNQDYLFNFAGTTSSSGDGTQISANAQGSLSSGSTFNLSLNGTIDQNQDTLTFQILTVQNAQITISTGTKNLYANGNNNNNSNNNNDNNDGSNSNNNNDQGINPVFQSGQINTVQKTITLTFQVTNNLNVQTTINSVSGTLEITKDQYQLGTVSSSGSVTVPSGHSSTLTISGTLTQNALNYLNDHYSHVSTLDVTVLNGQMNVDGVTNQGAQPQDLGSVTVTW